MRIFVHCFHMFFHMLGSRTGLRTQNGSGPGPRAGQAQGQAGARRHFGGRGPQNLKQYDFHILCHILFNIFSYFKDFLI